MPMLDVPGGSLYYEVEGDGPPLTLIHAGIAHLRMWDEHIPAFAARHRVIRYDTRGFGRTRTEEVPFSNRDDLAALLDHLGVDRTHLVGISRGGTIAVDFTLERPERVGGLVVVASTPSGFDFEDPSVTPTFERMEQLEEARDWDALVEEEIRFWCDGPSQGPDRLAPSVRERMIRWNRENYAAEAGDGKPLPLDPPATSRLEDVAAPTLLMWGDLDEPGALAGGSEMAARIPAARSIVVAGVAHMVNLERPAEFEAAVLDFLAEVDAA